MNSLWLAADWTCHVKRLESAAKDAGGATCMEYRWRRH